MPDGLPLFHHIAGRKVLVLGTGATADARRRLVNSAGGMVVDDVQPGVALAFIAGIQSPESLAGHLRQAGLLINVADRPELCDFIVPAIIRRSPVLVAVGTGGASSGLAKALRLRLEAWLPSGLGALAQGLAAARTALRHRFPNGDHRRHMLDTALSQGGMLDPLYDGAAERLATWLADAHPHQHDHQVEIHLRSDDPDDLTLREARLLGHADSLAYEPTVSPPILARARTDATRHPIPPGADAPPRPGLMIILRAGPNG